MLDICGLLLLGALIGAIARLIVPGYQALGFLVTMLVGVLGIVGGSFFAEQANIEGVLKWILIVGITVVIVLLVAGVTRRSPPR